MREVIPGRVGRALFRDGLDLDSSALEHVLLGSRSARHRAQVVLDRLERLGARLDAYEIVHPLGSGVMGEVWLATEMRLGRKVALKLLRADLMRETSRILRFEQEARAASALSHPNVCTILALGETATASATSRWSTSRARRCGAGWRRRGYRSARRSTSRSRWRRP